MVVKTFVWKLWRATACLVGLACVGGVFMPLVCSAADRPALKNALEKQFLVGAAIGSGQIAEGDSASLQLAAREFSSITPENMLKWAEVHPELKEFNFAPADQFVKFGEQHGMFIVGHCLVWHNQTPPWVFADDAGKPLSREALLERMREHISGVVGRYKGHIGGWDVVNEAIDDDGTLRKTKWREIIGDDYLEKAFQFAHASDPQAELYYNDYNEWKPEKRRAIKALIHDLKSKGVRVDGLGLQGHWGLDYPSAAELEAMFQDYSELDVKLMVTELDVTVLPDAQRARGADITRNEQLRKELDPYPNGLPVAMQKKLAEQYAEIFRIFVKHADKLDRVTFWGVHDGQTWRNNWPMRGRHDYPLLFDRELKGKPALDAVLQTAVGR